MISNMTTWELCETMALGKKTLFVKFDCHNDTATVDLSAEPEGRNLYTLKRGYHKNRWSEDVKKIIVILEGK